MRGVEWALKFGHRLTLQRVSAKSMHSPERATLKFPLKIFLSAYAHTLRACLWPVLVACGCCKLPQRERAAEHLCPPLICAAERPKRSLNPVNKLFKYHVDKL